MAKFNLDAENLIAKEEEKATKLEGMIKEIKENNLVKLENDFMLW